MKSILIKLAVLSFAVGAVAQSPLPPEIEDPECVGINKEPAHAKLRPQ